MIVRQIPGPGGIVASKRGSAWVFPFAEQRGSRTFVDKTGAFVQDVSYQAFGEPESTGAQPGSATHSPEQWNGGDALEPFGLAHLGARLYDPVIGRFLSRDPLVVPRTAASTNPYAFAMNDPVNRADPTGLDCKGPECYPPGGGDPSVPGGGPSPINDPCLYVSCVSPAWGAVSAKSTSVAYELTRSIPNVWSDKLEQERRDWEEYKRDSSDSRLDCFTSLGMFAGCAGNGIAASVSAAYYIASLPVQMVLGCRSSIWTPARATRT
jgi:RHS repeat-associated protein